MLSRRSMQWQKWRMVTLAPSCHCNVHFIETPARPPNLIPCEYFLWVYLKHKFKHSPRTIPTFTTFFCQQWMSSAGSFFLNINLNFFCCCLHKMVLFLLIFKISEVLLLLHLDEHLQKVCQQHF